MEFGDDYFIMFKIVEVKTDFVWKGGKASRRVDAPLTCYIVAEDETSRLITTKRRGDYIVHICISKWMIYC